MAALALAYPPLSGETPSTAPLDIATTTLPGANGSRNAARIQAKTWSTCQFRLNVSQVCSCTGAMCGATPALRTSRSPVAVSVGISGVPKHTHMLLTMVGWHAERVWLTPLALTDVRPFVVGVGHVLVRGRSK
jgi:hypothetical protein